MGSFDGYKVGSEGLKEVEDCFEFCFCVSDQNKAHGIRNSF